MIAGERMLRVLALAALCAGAVALPAWTHTDRPATSVSTADVPQPAPTSGCLLRSATVPPLPPEDVSGELTIFAAASLTDAFETLASAWEHAYPDSRLTLSFGASSALRAQIELGAPADLLASADTRNAQLLVDACLAPGPITSFAGNELALVVPSANPAGISSPADLAREGVRIVSAGPEVPITRYTDVVIDNLAGLEGYAPDFAEAVGANVVSEEGNVRAVLTKVELGEADAALVYATDARSSRGVDTIELPAAANVAAEYAVVRIDRSGQPALAAAFIDFLTGPEGQTVLAEYGFVPPPAPPSAEVEASGE